MQVRLFPALALLALATSLVAPAGASAAFYSGSSTADSIWSVNGHADYVYSYGGDDVVRADVYDVGSCGTGNDTLTLYYHTLVQYVTIFNWSYSGNFPWSSCERIYQKAY